MKILERYIGRTVAMSVVTVIMVISSLFLLIGFAGEFDKIGSSNYTFFMAVKYTLLLLPDRIYEFFPLATLLGSILGLGALANSSELVVIRSAGVSIFKIVAAIMKTALVLMAIAFIIGEVIAPPALQYAKLQQVKALSQNISLNTQYGLWARDSNTYIHVQRANNDGKLFDVHLYRLNEKYKLEQVLHAKTADYDGKNWQLKDIKQTDISQQKISVSHIASMEWKTLLDPELVSIVTFEPNKLSIWKLSSYINYLKDNGLETAQYELAFWSKVIMPFTIAAMVLLAVPYVFGSLRRTSVGQQILIGFLAGLVFFIANRLLGQMSIVYNFHPALGASVPTLLVFVGTFFLFRRRV
ncbi:Lipopolysaccharide export system permease protein LptG [hydrothermal vent metagenome]|uniref:Lipopolysaccharide export system permease protein LptG n=1 Tax=hydrothermal vent metagenome TaxID=652676 RepID=A0A3B0ZW74_9ZZZZ